jgi:hypothetical protein
MPTYLVERYLPGMQLDRVREGVGRSRQAAIDMRAEGLAVHHVQSLVVVEDELCLCRFTAASVNLVEEANRRADFPFSRISLARVARPSPGRSPRRPAPRRRADPHTQAGREDGIPRR